MRISPAEISTENERRCEVTALPANARLCHRCGEHYIGRACPKCPPALASAPPAAPVATRGAEVPKLVLRLTGQVRGGKNAMGVTKSGRHYAKSPFKKWRAEMMAQINAQGCGGILISTPTNVRIDYVAGDRKRRDQTGIFDALFHLLEHAQIIADDSLLWVSQSSRSYDKAAPGVTITFL
jgi:Holliday junction resolvase RusA-like endonuclease